ncbi:MAG: RNA polymerase sigma factor [Bacteroidetes bacterium]|nr:RNA polymerase sigma factor [Bacteroidota bacterium]
MDRLHEIIEHCKQNDHHSQKLIYEKFYGYGLKVAFRYVFDYELASDITNDGFVKVFNSISKFKCPDESQAEHMLLGWIKKIIANTAIDELRKSKNRPAYIEIPDYVWESKETGVSSDMNVLYKELIGYIKKLPPSYRTVFNLYVIDGFSHQEISRKLGISVGTSKSSLSKARNSLQKFLHKDFSEIEK